VDQTSVLDLKPYLPYVEAPEGAQGGFAAEPPPQSEVFLSPGMSWHEVTPEERALIEQSLALVYGVVLGAWEVRWKATDGRIEILEITRASLD